MRISLFDQWGAKNSAPVWAAFARGAQALGHTVQRHDTSADLAVIWSLVWAGRMRANQAIYNQFRNSGRNVLILEVGTLRRGVTWKMAINGLNNGAVWGQGLDPLRPHTLGLQLQPWHQAGEDIVVLVQRHDSEQWPRSISTDQWLSQVCESLRCYTDRTIRVRPHPRQPVNIPPGCVRDQPLKLADTYDDFDLCHSLQGAWAAVNYNSGVGIAAVIAGTPLFCDPSSRAAPVANTLWHHIEKPQMPDRTQWLLEISHSEWTVAEIATGFPLARFGLAL
jgi:hypothetical protein